MTQCYYKPANAWCGDFIPFYWKGNYRLFYLHDWRTNVSEGLETGWYQVATSDFMNYSEYGPMHIPGVTGSVIHANGLFHIFYTGFHPGPEWIDGVTLQTVSHAMSEDLIHWQLIPEDTFLAPVDQYVQLDWRDPFVFWNDTQSEYWMLVSTRLQGAPEGRGGCLALCTSKNLHSWEVKDPFWAPGLYYTPECSELFRMGDWWYLIYSTFTERFATHYRFSRTLNGPWLAPENDTFDSRGFYAAKTASDGSHRFIFGWNPTKCGEHDYANWDWGGNLVVHEVIQGTDGYLSVKIPESVDRIYSQSEYARFEPLLGSWSINNHQLCAESPSSFSCALSGELPGQCKISLRVLFRSKTRRVGVLLRANPDLAHSYYLRFEPGRDRIVFDAGIMHSYTGWKSFPFEIELERPLKLEPDRFYKMKIIIEGSICEVYVDDIIALSTRLYDHKSGRLGLFVSEGSAIFEDVVVSTIN